LYIIFIGSKYSNEYNSESDFENLKETYLHETNLHENRSQMEEKIDNITKSIELKSKNHDSYDTLNCNYQI